MALLAPFDRPLALRLRGEVAWPKSSPAPTVPPIEPPVDRPTQPSTGWGSRPETARFLAHVLLTDTARMQPVLQELEASVDEDVVVWSPCVSTSSRAELVAALFESDDAITQVKVSILGVSTCGDTVHVEWHLEGRFNNAGFLNDDVLVEPSGAMVEANGVLVVVFDGDRATRIRCYYDSLGLLEQVIRPTEP